MSTHKPAKPARPSGRRPGPSGTRDAILSAARRRFAEAGYRRTALRAIAADAGVDQKLIAHYFGTKQQLFVTAIGLPIDPTAVLPAVLRDATEAQVAERLAWGVAQLLGDPQLHERLVAALRATASEPEIARAMREFFPGEVLAAVQDQLGPGDGALRLNLFGSQLVGILMGRDVIGVEPLASLPPDQVARAIAPTLARYLVGDLN